MYDWQTLVKTGDLEIRLPSVIFREEFEEEDDYSSPVDVFVHWIKVVTYETTYVIPREPKKKNNGL